MTGKCDFHILRLSISGYQMLRNDHRDDDENAASSGICLAKSQPCLQSFGQISELVLSSMSRTKHIFHLVVVSLLFMSVYYSSLYWVVVLNIYNFIRNSVQDSLFSNS